MDGEVIIGLTLDRKSFEKEIEATERKLNDLVADYQEFSKSKGFNEQSNEAIRLRKEIEKTSNTLQNLKNKQNEINNQGFKNAMSYADNIKDSIKSTVAHVGKWALAIIGIRSIYSGIRSAISMVSAENEQVAGQINIMKSVIANALLPIVQQVLNIIAKIMIYVNYIFQRLTGRALFDFDKAWSNANKNSKATASNAAKIRKQLAGFDEMNVLSDTSTGSSGGTGGVGNVALTNPFKDWQNVEIPGWVDKIVEFGKWVLENWEDVVQALLLIKIFFDILTGNWAGLVLDIILYLITQFPRLKDAIVEVGKGIWEYIKLLVAGLIVQIQLKLSALSAIIFAAVNLFLAPFKTFRQTVIEVFENIKKIVKGVFEVIKGIFTGDMKTVMNGFKKIFEGVFGALWSIAKAPLNLIINGINALIKGANRIKIQVPSWVPSIGGKNFGINIPQIPKLAKGGIVNLPGKGVPVGAALTGERSAEGVIPLTDSQQMALLGEAIGKYVTINATIPVYAYNRQVDRQIKRIQAEDNFAYNR